MIILFILGLLIGAVVVIFALQNVSIITVTFFSYQLTGSLALILSLAIASGLVVALLLLLPESFNNYRRYRSLKKENEALSEELRKQKEITVFSKHTPATPEIISHIEHGVIDDSVL